MLLAKNAKARFKIKILNKIRKEKGCFVILRVKHKRMDQRSSKRSSSTSTTKKLLIFKTSTAKTVVSRASFTKFEIVGKINRGNTNIFVKI